MVQVCIKVVMLFAIVMVCRGWSVNPAARNNNPMMKSQTKVIPSVTRSLEIVPTKNENNNYNNNNNNVSSRRSYMENVCRMVGTTTTMLLVFGGGGHSTDSASAMATIDVNNALAREYTAFPGLYPTVATKIVNGAKDEPYKSKKDVYAVLNEIEQERLKQYDSSIVIKKPDKALQQFKTSQICKYECGGRASSSFRDEQIKAVQAARQ